MIFLEEKISDTLEEVKPLLQKHWEESERYYGFSLDPDYELYLRLEREGLTKSYAARIENKIVGYAVFFVQYSHHYKTVLMAKQDIIFIDKCFRGRGEFSQWCGEQLKNIGVKVIVYNIKAHNKSFDEYVKLVRL